MNSSTSGASMRPTDDSIAAMMARPDGGKVLLLVLDGLGGFRNAESQSELSAAVVPNLDRLAREGALGLHDPVGRGITPGSGAGHLGLFGYDPLIYEIGRGALSAAGVGFDLGRGDVAARVNFCTLAPDGTVADRRAGRLPTSETAVLCDMLNKSVSLANAQAVFIPERDHRALLVLRGSGLDPNVSDTDPQREGIEPRLPQPKQPAAKRTVEIVADLLDQVGLALADRDRGNFILLRGFDTRPNLPPFGDRFNVRPAAVAVYPMYLGIARILGFETLKVDGGLDEEIDGLEKLVPDYDFLFMHVKAPDSAGEDGDFKRKVAAIEEVDCTIPRILSSGIDVLAITGDHSTPSQMAAHSWHPVPTLLWGGSAPSDHLARFDEVNCRVGSLGRFKGKYLLPQMLAAAGRLDKYGA